MFAADPAKLTERTPPLQTMLTVAEPGSAARPWLHVFPATFAPGEMSPTGVAFEINVGLLKTDEVRSIFTAPQTTSG